MAAQADLVNQQITNYIRGKVTEMIIVGVSLILYLHSLTYVTLVLLAGIVSVSVCSSHVGAVLATIPVIVIALSQWD